MEGKQGRVTTVMYEADVIVNDMRAITSATQPDLTRVSTFILLRPRCSPRGLAVVASLQEN
jgi:hypothetical protein